MTFFSFVLTVLVSSVVAVIVTAGGEKKRIEDARKTSELLGTLRKTANEQTVAMNRAMNDLNEFVTDNRKVNEGNQQAIRMMNGQVNTITSKTDKLLNRMDACEDRLRSVNVDEQITAKNSRDIAVCVKAATDAKALSEYAVKQCRSLTSKLAVKPKAPEAAKPKPIFTRAQETKPKSKSEARRLAVQKDAGKKV